MRATPILALTSLVAGLAAGCGGGPEVDLTVMSASTTVSYLVSPEGRLAVTDGTSLQTEPVGETLHETQLTDEQMQRLGKVIHDSGFYFADPPFRAADQPMMHYRVRIRDGMWENQMQFAGAVVPSLAPIVEELNRHLPAGREIPYFMDRDAPPDGRDVLTPPPGF